MKLSSVFTRARVLSFLVAAAVLLPVSVAPGGAMRIRGACASGACCVEFGSICSSWDLVGDLADYYLSNSGTCGWSTQTTKQDADPSGT